MTFEETSETFSKQSWDVGKCGITRQLVKFAPQLAFLPQRTCNGAAAGVRVRDLSRRDEPKQKEILKKALLSGLSLHG